MKPIIQIDTREQLPLVFDASTLNYETEWATLPVGDYGVRGFSGAHKDDLTLFAVERKSLSDLCGSLGSGRERFYNEIKRARAYTFFGLVIEATEDDILLHRYRSKILPASVMGSLLSLQVNYDVHVYFCKDAAGTARTVRLLVEYFWKRQMKQHKRLARLTK